MMSTCCSKHVEAWNKYIEKECVKLVINQKCVFQTYGSVVIIWTILTSTHFYQTDERAKPESFIAKWHSYLCLRNKVEAFIEDEE
jgi:hypothetical protein